MIKQMKKPYLHSWKRFLQVLQKDIMPTYIKHEKTFDFISIHGRMHISRALIFGEFMARYYFRELSISPSFDRIRYAIAFHDSGRKGNGFDIWESDSASLCASYLKKNPICAILNPETAGELITKNGRNHWDLDKRIVHDADVLEIMRPCCGHGGINGFRKNALRFLGHRDPDGKTYGNDYTREQLIKEAWMFISNSEDKKPELENSENYFANVMDILLKLKADCPLVTEYIFES